jgi:hypothetical protein
MNRQSLICVRNSLHWYDAIFRTHGQSGTITDGMWTSRDRPPPYYSNAMTLTSSDIVAQMATLQGLAAVLDRPWSVKDSFSALDLSPLGFRSIFEAEWIWTDDPDVTTPDRGVAVWRPVTTPTELQRWEAAWRANGSPTDRPVFMPELLGDTTIAIFAGYRGDDIVAGCAANRSAEAVGFSNFFVADGDQEVATAAAIDVVSRFGGGLPVVGYERGERLASMSRLGFRAVGPLRVWVTLAG